MNKKLINRIEKLFLTKISKNPTWGKNQIELVFKEAVAQAALEYIDEKETPVEEKISNLPWNPIKDIEKYNKQKKDLQERIQKDIEEYTVEKSIADYNKQKGIADIPDDEPPFDDE